MADKTTESVQSVNLYFGKKDIDLCQWVHSVPRGIFSYLVREAMKAHLNHDEEYRMQTFNNKKVKTTPITKPLSLSYDSEEDEKVSTYLLGFDDNMRSFEVKQVLRKYLQPKEGTTPSIKPVTQTQHVVKKEESAAPVKTPPKEEKNEPVTASNPMMSKFMLEARNRSRKK